MIQSHFKPEVIDRCLSDIAPQNVCRYKFPRRSGSIGGGRSGFICMGEVLCHADERVNKYRWVHQKQILLAYSDRQRSQQEEANKSYGRQNVKQK